jgi:signal transduction histidine kinase
MSATELKSPGPWLVDLPPTAGHRRAAAAVAAVMVACFAAVAPFAGRPLVALNAFFPTLDAVVFVSDLVTAVLLFGQYAISRSRALLALAAGYLFTAFIVVPHALTFAGAFSPTGLLGSNIQTGSWLFIFWHLGFALSLLLYALLRRAPVKHGADDGPALPAIALTVAAMFALVCGLTWLSTAGAGLLPRIITDQRTMDPFVVYPIGLTIGVSAAGLAVLAIGRISLLDLWLMIVALVLILELAFSGLLPSIRFSLGFYAGRFFSLVTASVVLIIVLAETIRLYGQLARSNDLLQRERNSKLMNLEAVAASLAHEVRQPLTAISASADAASLFLKRSPPDLGEARSALKGLVESCHRLSDIFGNIRALFGRADMPTGPVDLNGLALDVLRLLEPDLRREQIGTELRLASNLPTIMAHRGQLQEVIHNLVANAVEAMQAAGRPRVLTIETGIDRSGSVMLEVRDTGPGINPVQSDTIFDAFVSTKPQGMGLGLAICRMIVEKHGGRLKVTPARPHGAAFQITLPTAGAAASTPTRVSAGLEMEGTRTV